MNEIYDKYIGSEGLKQFKSTEEIYYYFLSANIQRMFPGEEIDWNETGDAACLATKHWEEIQDE
jgi:hypothetical protein